MRKIGFVNGCFDILHIGHLKLFEFCRSQCDYLIVGIDSDSMVKKAKGESRPYNNEADRKYFLENIKAVDKVFIFNSHSFLENIKAVDKVFIFNSHSFLENKLSTLSPDIMFVGSDYRDRKVIGSQFAKELKFFEKINGYSTTKLIQNITFR